MEILSENQYGEYETFVKGHPNGYFMQSPRWRHVKNNWGHFVVVSRDESGAIVGGMLILTLKLKNGKYFMYAPRGPVCDYSDENVFCDLVDGARQIAADIGGDNFKIDPMVLETNRTFIDMAKRAGFGFVENQGDHDTIQRRNNYMLPLKGQTPETLLANFHQKWRYNIRLAGRKGVTCRVGTKEDLPAFMKIYEKTGERDGFAIRPVEYFERMLDALDDEVRLYLCEYEGRVISGAITTNCAGKTAYVYGASDNEMRNFMPNHLMQWTMINWALETDCYLYDFQAIPLDLSGDDPMHGVYSFKKGFGGDIYTFAGEFIMKF